MDKQAEARAYLGIPDDAGITIRQEIVDAVTADDFGELPPEITTNPQWEAATDHDREEIARFAAFLRVAGNPPALGVSVSAGEDA